MAVSARVRWILGVAGLAAGLLALLAFGAVAQESAAPPPANATPGQVGVSGAVLGAILPVAAPGYRLQMTELVWEPGAYATRHTHPIAQVVCVVEGSFGMEIEQGAGRLTRAATGGTPVPPEPIPLNTPVILAPRDCIVYDDFAAPHVHTVWNAGEGRTVIWSADLVKTGEPYTTYVNDEGTPIPE